MPQTGVQHAWFLYKTYHSLIQFCSLTHSLFALLLSLTLTQCQLPESSDPAGLLHHNIPSPWEALSALLHKRIQALPQIQLPPLDDSHILSTDSSLLLRSSPPFFNCPQSSLLTFLLE